MKNINWKYIIITSLSCLLSVFLGLVVWDSLPDKMAIHFDVYNQPDNFVSKGFAVFALPLIMMGTQVICCIVTDINSSSHGGQKKFERITKWIIPVITFVLQILTISFNLGKNVDIRKSCALVVGIMFLVIGSNLPKLDYVKNYKFDTETARKINRFMGFETVIMGILMIISIFLPPVATVICLFMLIPYTLIGVIYTIIKSRKKSGN